MCDFRLALALPLPVGIGKLSRETGVAFARLYVRGVETAITFAGQKPAFLMQLSGAEVPSVSRWPVSAAAEVSLVSKSARGCVLCAKKLALRARKGPKLAFYGVLGEFFRDNAARGASLGELCRATGLMLLMLGERCRAAGVASMPGTTRGSGQARRPQPGRSRSRVIAPNEPPAPASCGGGRNTKNARDPSSDKQRNRCKRR